MRRDPPRADRHRDVSVQAEAGGYFCDASEYIHLNPVRARLLDAGRPDLLEYRWSSFPLFAQMARLPDWLRRDRVFGALELPDEGRGSRRRYLGWLAARTRDVLEQEPSADESGRWRELQRGWYLGSESFGDRLMDWAAGAVAGRKRASYSGEDLRGHDQGEAERLLALGLERLGLTLAQIGGAAESGPAQAGAGLANQEPHGRGRRVDRCAPGDGPS